jgi:hypothetical protein
LSPAESIHFPVPCPGETPDGAATQQPNKRIFAESAALYTPGTTPRPHRSMHDIVTSAPAPAGTKPALNAGRRRFLAACGALASLPWLPSCAGREFDIVTVLAEQLRVRGSRFGRIARASFPQPFDMAAVQERFKRRFGEPGVTGLKSSNVVEHFRRLVRSDFEQDRVALVSGWFVAETERELFALGHDRPP